MSNSQPDSNVFSVRIVSIDHYMALPISGYDTCYSSFQGDKFGVVSKVYTPMEHGVEGSIWQFAKAFVAINDCAHHQLISHWLNTHAVLEPFVIATNKQLSVVHLICKLLHPHFRDTMTINALARELLVNAGGVIKITFCSGKYSMEMSSEIYKSWNFFDQALPSDLKKRGIAVDDTNSLHGLRLLIKDYPYAVDGLKIWFAIEKWVRDYCSFYYKTDGMVQQDPELIESCTIIIWIASAPHAAVNFGQFAYAGYSLNRPTLSRRLMPEKGTPEYAELEKNPDKVFFRTITSQLQTFIGMSVVEVLSKHASRRINKQSFVWKSIIKPMTEADVCSFVLRGGKNWGDDQCWDLVRVKVAWWAKAKWLVDFQQLEQTIRCLEVNRLHTRIRGGRQTVEWEPLNRGFLKFNVDGAAKGNPCQAAIRGVLREEEGVVKILFSIPIGISKANTAEVMAIKEAFKLFGVSKWVGSHCLIVESDS
ncbi:PLAT/LH2 domain-containing lipoxygenase family protein, putative [Theobroma cacao]|uniref:PLAT/LH2 domain-containing lipoxygenase family protein, putative n=1 Tax=Theobroma cacao TaxID=3641 RepID=A0A061F9Y8_THECC|nr:PLAT/LH2 domain-containing lipoxygenase family protein, putative [Theobroma cacao]